MNVFFVQEKTALATKVRSTRKYYFNAQGATECFLLQSTVPTSTPIVQNEKMFASIVNLQFSVRCAGNYLNLINTQTHNGKIDIVGTLRAMAV